MEKKWRDWSIYSLGDHALVFAQHATMDQSILIKIKRLNQFIFNKKIKGIKDIIPSYHTLTIVYDINQFIDNTNNVIDELNAFSDEILSAFEKTLLEDTMNENDFIKVPVCYDTIFGLDIENISKQKNISIEEIVQIHTSTVYHVYSIGFLPGFTYMGKINEKIKMPRHDKPRKQVAAGSVGIAGLQTGIYPCNAPGGWQIIGKTPWNIFNPDPNKLSKFKVGDQVQFYAISLKEFDLINENK